MCSEKVSGARKSTDREFWNNTGVQVISSFFPYNPNLA